MEHLLDNNIFAHISLFRTHLPVSKIEIVTNGDVLNEERLYRLFTSGLSALR